MQVSTENAPKHIVTHRRSTRPTSSAGINWETAQECAGPVGRSRFVSGTRLFLLSIRPRPRANNPIRSAVRDYAQGTKGYDLASDVQADGTSASFPFVRGVCLMIRNDPTR